MIVTSGLGAAVAAYSSSADCMAKLRAGTWGAATSAAAKAAYASCLKSTPLVPNPAGPATVGVQATGFAQRLQQPAGVVSPAPGGAPVGVGAYVPNCARNICDEVAKVQASGGTVSASLQAKCSSWTATCGDGAGDAAGIQATSDAELTAGTTGDIMTWLSDNKGTVGVVAVVALGLILWKAL